MTAPKSAAPRPRRQGLPTSLKIVAADEVRRQIFEGQLRPGTRIDQDRIAEQLGISKLPVREAVIELSAEGIVQLEPRRGAFVATLAREDILDQYWMLGVISGMAAERAADRLTDADLDTLTAMAAEMESSTSTETEELLNHQFHRIINRATGSRRLTAEIKTLSRAIPQGFYESHAGWRESTTHDHHEIVQALRERDGATARRLTEDHFRRGGDQAVALLEARGFWSDTGE